jgi:hypothetical protein
VLHEAPTQPKRVAPVRLFSYLWAITISCVAFDIAGLLYVFLHIPASGIHDDLYFDFILACLFTSGMILFTFAMQRNAAAGSQVRYFRLGWYWALICGIPSFLIGRRPLTRFSSEYLPAYVTLYVLILFFIYWAVACFLADRRMKRAQVERIAD